ncbi:MAG TPA: ribosome-associated translation inhibitor RaiA [Jiangellales bacterium]|nr:ribosome-associated translation inhibitor RaiA [Jiangellales bacterium]
MDIVVKGRHCEVSDRFRQHVADKLAKVERLDQKVIRIDVEVCKERNPRQADQRERIELTVHSKGPVVRAEAAAEDRYGALDLAVDRLAGQLRRAADRRRIHRGSRTPISVGQAMAAVNGSGAATATATPTVRVEHVETDVAPSGPLEVDGDGPLVVREKTHEAAPMGLDQALYEMELVGHDFYLFVDAGTRQPSVVYRRRGYDYGVIRLAV